MVAKLGEQRRRIFEEKSITPDRVTEETWLDGIRPDIVAHIQGKCLIVEIAVTHFCDARKISIIVERNTPAIEIDLSRLPRDLPAGAAEEAILRTAPRSWIYNPIQSNAEDELRTNEQLRLAALEEDGRKRAAVLESRARDFAKAYATRPARVPLDEENKIKARISLINDAGLSDRIGISNGSDGCFILNCEQWQSSIIEWLLIQTDHRNFSEFDIGSLIKLIRSQNMLKPIFAKDISPQLATATRAITPEFLTPEEGVAEYLTYLSKAGLVRSRGQRWAGDRNTVENARSKLANMASRRKAFLDLKARLRGIQNTVKDHVSIDVNLWLKTRLDKYDGLTPSQVMERGNYWGLLEAVDDLRRMLDPGGRVQKDLLGLPLEHWRKGREEETDRAAAERERKRLDDAHTSDVERYDRLIQRVQEIIGYYAANEWLATRQAALGGLSLAQISAISSEQEAELTASLREEIERSRRQAAIDSEKMEKQHVLRREASKSFGDEEKADIWMRSTVPAIGGRPSEVCVDDESLKKCLGALQPLRSSRRRR